MMEPRLGEVAQEGKFNEAEKLSDCQTTEKYLCVKYDISTSPLCL